MEELKKYQKSNLDDALKKDYAHALTNEEFKKTVKKLKLKDSIAYKYTSKIERNLQLISKLPQKSENYKLLTVNCYSPGGPIPHKMAQGFDAPPTLERSGSELRRAVTSLIPMVGI